MMAAFLALAQLVPPPGLGSWALSAAAERWCSESGAPHCATGARRDLAAACVSAIVVCTAEPSAVAGAVVPLVERSAAGSCAPPAADAPSGSGTAPGSVGVEGLHRCSRLIELCCDSDSRLSALAPDHGIRSLRITREDRFDLPRGLQRVLALIASGDAADVWASLPCTVWSTWNYVNAAIHGPKFRARLAWRRRLSIRMVGHVEACFLAALARGGACHFEWPRHCSGWQRPRVRRLLRVVGLELAAFDGCQFGVMASPELLALKPWCVATSRPAVWQALQGRLCTRDHEHGRLRGQAAVHSGHYTDALCHCVLKALAADGAAAEGGPSAARRVSPLLEPTTPSPPAAPAASLEAPSLTAGGDALGAWADAVTAAPSGFGSYAAAFLAGSVARASGRSRDVLPLPPVGAEAVSWPLLCGRADAHHLARMLDVSCAALNWLYTLGQCGPVPCSTSAIQRQMCVRILTKLVDAASLLAEAAPTAPLTACAFAALTLQDPASAYPSLLADRIALVDGCGNLDPVPCLPAEHATIVQSPDLMFARGTGCLPRSLVYDGGPRQEYIALVRRQLRAGKVALVGQACATGRVFAVAKRGTEQQREIWHGGQVTDAAAAPPPPPELANPAALADLEASADRPLWVSGRDAEVFFDQLALPPALRSFMGRPAVQLSELTEGLVGQQPALTMNEVSSRLEPGLTLEAALALGTLTPVSTVWPMGFGWSSHIAQSFMLSCAREAGVDSAQMVREEGALPTGDSGALAIATDDIQHFLRASPQEVAQMSVPPLSVLDEVWASRGVRPQAKKSFDLQPRATCLGIEMHGGTRLSPRAARLRDLLLGAAALLRRPVASPRQVATFGGMVQWHNLMARPFFSCLGDYYAFVRLEPADHPRAVWPSVVSELCLNVSLLHCWMVDLCRPWWSFLPVTDASAAFGFGYCQAPVSPELSRAAAAHAGRLGHHFRLEGTPGGQPEKPRSGPGLRLPLRPRQFRVVFGARARYTAHSGALEAHGVVLALRRILRTGRFHAHRGAFLVDAQFVRAALQKGRSSAPTLRLAVAQAGALCLAGDLRLRFGYLPSEESGGRSQPRVRTSAAHAP
mmetsp:Transcript_179202/g.568670  ORF Transcript_179202/g.568670 Transcript_179202/m.568670 type:complete len:1089 (-) Transcript_179202:910-4176(-)